MTFESCGVARALPLRPWLLSLASLALFLLAGITTARAADADVVEADARAALAALLETTPAAKDLLPQAKAVLIFPDIVKAGFMVGVQYGEGVAIVNDQVMGHFKIRAASYGPQAGMQSYAYAMLLMTDAAVDYLKKSNGWEIGVGPSIVIVDAGKAKTLTTTTAKDDIYGFIFGQKGLMAGLGVQGSKISKVER